MKFVLGLMCDRALMNYLVFIGIISLASRVAEAGSLRHAGTNAAVDEEDWDRRNLVETRSVLWDATGEPWVSSSGGSTQLRNFTDVGYMSGNVPIPDWPVGVSITDYGAIANDEISDAQALRDAVAACPPYRAVFIPNGRYIIDEAIEFNSTFNNFVIRGESRDEAVLFFPKHMHEIEQVAESSTYFISFEGGTNRGMEDLSLTLRDESKATGYFLDPYKTKQKEAHWFNSGENMISIGNRNTDSWLRNLYIKNANTAIRVVGIFTSRITISDIVNDKFMLRTNVGMGRDGHVGIASNGNFVLIHNIINTGVMHHALDLNGAKDTVYSRIAGPNLLPDFHAQGNRYNLYTEFDFGRGKPSWRDRDNTNGGRKNLQWETFWGMKSSEDFNFLDPADQCIMVGIPNDANTSIGVDYHHEAIDPDELVPANIYLAQMEETAGKVPPPDVALTIPPRPQAYEDLATILFPTDDSYVGLRSGDRDKNYGFSDRFVVRRNAQEAYVKFDLTKLSASYSKIYYVKLKLAVRFSIKDNFRLEIRNMTDTSWSEASLTYNNRPSSDSKIAEMQLFKVDIPEYSYIEVDITENVKNVLARGEKSMSLHFVGVDKDRALSIKSHDSANPVHLVAYLEQDSPAEEVSTWTPIDDAYTEQINSMRTINYGSTSRFKMRQFRNEGFMKFDLTGLGSNMVNPVITSAKLHAFATINLKSAFNLQIKNVTDNSWSEDTLNFNNKPAAYDIVAETFYDKSILPTWTWTYIDLTNHVQHVNGLGLSVFSLHFSGGGEAHPTKDAGLAFRSKEDSSGINAPYLEVSVFDDVPASPLIPTGPDQLTGLQATPGMTSVTLDWNIGTAALAPITYNVYRYDTSGYVVKAMGLTTPTYTDYRVVTDSSNVVFPLTYVVTAVDIAGDESMFSENVTVSLL